MTPLRKHVASLLAVVATAATVVLFSHAQTQPAPVPATPPQTAPSQPASTMNHNVVVLDPAHGGPDLGAKLDDRVLEKDVTVALATRLRAALTTAGFTVVSTRDADLLTPMTTDQRAETANRAHAVACIVIHATGSGTGVHLYTSTLEPGPADTEDADARPTFEPTPWDLAQEDSISQSLRLQDDLNASLGTANLPVVMGRAAVRPLDNLMCPAVAVEVAPLAAASGDMTPVTDPDYQQRIADALTRAIQTWRGHADPPAPSAPAAEAVPADQTRAAAKATAAADAAGIAAAKAHASGGTQ